MVISQGQQIQDQQGQWQLSQGQRIQDQHGQRQLSQGQHTHVVSQCHKNKINSCI